MPTALDNPWRFVLTRMSGTVYGELTNASDRRLQVSVHGIPSASCKIPVRHKWATTVLNEDCLLRVYRGGTLVFHGFVVSAEEVGDQNTQTLQVTAAGAWWRMTKRTVPASRTENGYSIDTTDYPVEFNLLMNAVNLEAYSGISHV